MEARRQIAEFLYRALAWWIDGLWSGCPRALKARLFKPRDHIRLDVHEDRIEIGRWAGVSGSVERVAEIPLADPSTGLRELTDRLDIAQADVTAVLRRESALTTTLQFPASAGPRLEAILHHELERLTPVPIDEFVYGYCITRRDTATDKLDVFVALLRREAFDRQMARLRALGFEPGVVSVVDAEDRPAPLNLLARAPRLRLPFVEWPFRPAVAAVVLIALLFVLFAPLPRYASVLAENDAAVGALRERAVEARAIGDAEASQHERRRYLADRQQGYRSPLDVLERLSAALPDQAWISRLSLSPSEVTIQGEATRASSLLEVVASIEGLSDAEFQAPVALNGASGKEQFVIRAHLGTPEP